MPDLKHPQKLTKVDSYTHKQNFAILTLTRPQAEKLVQIINSEDGHEPALHIGTTYRHYIFLLTNLHLFILIMMFDLYSNERF